MRKESLLECWVCEEEVEKMLVEVNQIHPDYNCIKEETATHEPSPNSIELDKTRLRWSCCSGGRVEECSCSEQHPLQTLLLSLVHSHPSSADIILLTPDSTLLD